MKIVKITTLLVMGSASGLLIGCSQNEPSASEPTAKIEKIPEAPATEIAKPAAMPAPAVAATPETAPATDQAQGLIEKVKSLIAEKNYSEATTVLKDLSALKLTPEQQQIVDDLKTQVTKATLDQSTGEASKAAGGLLK